MSLWFGIYIVHMIKTVSYLINYFLRFCGRDKRRLRNNLVKVLIQAIQKVPFIRVG